MRPYLEQRLAELKAIIAWDRDYINHEKPDEILRAAWEARRKRLNEIREEVEAYKQLKRYNAASWNRDAGI